MTRWEIHGSELGNCNCAYSCPCQFGELPNDGTCEAAVGYVIDSGFHGGVSLDGVKMAATYKWPGPIHEGNGEMQLIIDERASPEQRDAIQKIMSGEDTNEAATMWWVYSAMCTTRHETLYRPIDIQIDIPARQGTISVDGVFDVSAHPIVHPVSGKDHRIRLDLPEGFEFAIGEIASGTTKTQGVVSLEKNDESFAVFAELHLSGEGVIRDAA